MTSNELDKLVSARVIAELKKIVPQLVKPLVQEAVAGALASLLAEGIVKGAPMVHQSQPTVPQRQKPVVANRQELTKEDIRRRFLEEQEDIQPLRTAATPMRAPTSNGMGGIFDTVEPFDESELVEGGVGTKSILEEANNPMLVNDSYTGFLKKDYGPVMKALKEKRR